MLKLFDILMYGLLIFDMLINMSDKLLERWAAAMIQVAFLIVMTIVMTIALNKIRKFSKKISSTGIIADEKIILAH